MLIKLESCVVLVNANAFIPAVTTAPVLDVKAKAEVKLMPSHSMFLQPLNIKIFPPFVTPEVKVTPAPTKEMPDTLFK